MLEAYFFVLLSPRLHFVSSERCGKGYASFFLCLTLRFADYTSVAVRRDMMNGMRGSVGGGWSADGERWRESNGWHVEGARLGMRGSVGGGWSADT